MYNIPSGVNIVSGSSITLSASGFSTDVNYPGWLLSEPFATPKSLISSNAAVLEFDDYFKLAVPQAFTGSVITEFTPLGGERFYPETDTIDPWLTNWQAGWTVCSDWGLCPISYSQVTGTVGLDSGGYYIEPTGGIAAGTLRFNQTEYGFSTGSVTFNWSGECRFKLDPYQGFEVFTIDIFYPGDTLPYRSERYTGICPTGIINVPTNGQIKITTDSLFSYLLESSLGAGIYELNTEHTIIPRVPGQYSVSGNSFMSLEVSGNIGCDFELSISSTGKVYIPAVFYRRLSASIVFTPSNISNTPILDRANLYMWPFYPLTFNGPIQKGNRLSQFIPSNQISYTDCCYFIFNEKVTGSPENIGYKHYLSKSNMPDWVESEDIDLAATAFPALNSGVPNISLWTTEAAVPTVECLVDLGYCKTVLKEFQSKQLFYCPSPGYSFVNGKAVFVNLDVIVNRGKGTFQKYDMVAASPGEPLTGTWKSLARRDPYADTCIRSSYLANIVNCGSVSGNTFKEIASENFFKQALDIQGVPVKVRDSFHDRCKCYFITEGLYKISAALYDAMPVVSSVDYNHLLFSPIPQYRTYASYLSPVNGVYNLPFQPDYIEVYVGTRKIGVTLSGASFVVENNPTVEVRMIGKNYMVTPAGKIDSSIGISYLGNNFELPRLEVSVKTDYRKQGWITLSQGVYVNSMDNLDE